MADQQHRHHPLPPAPTQQQQPDPYYQNQQQQQQVPYNHQSQQDSYAYSPQQQTQPHQSPTAVSPRTQVPQNFPQQPQQVHSPATLQPPPSSSSKQRTSSFQSARTHKSSGSHGKSDAHETSAEKEAKRLHSKADPTMAISEAEPATIQAMTKSSLAPLRSIQHKDAFGNPIGSSSLESALLVMPLSFVTDEKMQPILTGPTPPAVVGNVPSTPFAVLKPPSMAAIHAEDQPDTESVANWNRRSSYYAGGQTPRSANDGHYAGSRPMSMRPENNQYDYNQAANRSSYFDPMNPNANGNSNGGYGPGPSRNRASRMMSEPLNAYGRNDNVYPMPHKDRSYETVTSAGVSGNSEQAGYQTDPTSSDNSSIDRTTTAIKRQQEPVNDYGIGFSQPAAYQNDTFTFNNGAPRQIGAGNGAGYRQQPAPVQGYAPQPGAMGPPPVPRKDVNGGGGGGMLRKQSSGKRPDVGEKRKSWFSRRFSKAS